MKDKDCFVFKTLVINEKITLHVIDINCIDENLKAIIDKYIISIRKGQNSAWDINTTKKEILSFLETKSKNEGVTTNTQIGAIAEFFIHLWLNVLNFKQECLFKNLEENSVKKGFDGYYSQNNEEWIVESKSGYSKTANICHSAKIDEAYNDLKNKIAGKTSNNPWEEAYNHADLQAVNTNQQIKKHIEKYSIDFINKKFYKVDDFNIIPCSTIFYFEEWTPLAQEEILEELQSKIQMLNCNKMIAICVNKGSTELFFDYLRSEE